MKSLKERQADRAKRAKENNTDPTANKLTYGDGSHLDNGGRGNGSDNSGLNGNDTNEPNPPGSDTGGATKAFADMTGAELDAAYAASGKEIAGFSGMRVADKAAALEKAKAENGGGW